MTTLAHGDSITPEWLLASGWFALPLGERQPMTIYRRLLGSDIIGDRYMVSGEDLCIDVSVSCADGGRWHVWITKAYGHRGAPQSWVHVRMMGAPAELVLLYEALSGRQFSPSVMLADRGRPLFSDGAA